MIRRGALGSLVLFAMMLVVAVQPALAATPDPADDPTRVSLSTLRPRIAAAKDDSAAVYDDGCHVAHPVTRPTHCTYGRRDGTTRVVVIGDSIAAQWWAAIDGAARKGGWRVTWMTKTACPAADVTVRSSGAPYAACNTWRRNVVTKVRGLARVDLVVMAGSTQSTLLRRSNGAVISDPAAKRAEWQAGYQRTVARLAGQVRRVAILRDTPVFSTVVPSCLAAHGGRTEPCSRARSSALSTPHRQAEIAVDAAYPWVRATDLTDRLCQPTRCWPVTSDRLLRYRDAHHLTNTYSAAMAPAMYSRLRWLMR
jgi:hypothetical protein